MNSKEVAQTSIFYSYTKNINGFAAHLEEEVARQIASRNIDIYKFEHLAIKTLAIYQHCFLDLIPKLVMKRRIIIIGVLMVDQSTLT